MTTVLQVMEATEGGTRRHLRDLVGSLDPAEFRTALAVSSRRDPAFQEDIAGYAARGVVAYEVPMRRGIAPFADVASLLRLIVCVRKVGPGLIHAHSSKAGFLSRLAGAVCRVPVVYTPHVLPFLMAERPRLRVLYRCLERAVKGLTATLIAVSEEEVREALGLGYAPGRVALIRNGVAGAAGVGPVRAREAEALTVGFFGRLTRQKGPDLLIEAASEIVAHLPHVKVLMYGDGAMALTLRRQVAAAQLEGHVTFKGAYAQGDAVALMRQCDVIVVPSRWEGFPYVVLEAFQAGVPVVASAVGGVPDLIRSGFNGLCVAPGESEPLCDGVLGLLRDPLKRRQFAEQARAELPVYSIEAMSSAVCGVYRRVLGQIP